MTEPPNESVEEAVKSVEEAVKRIFGPIEKRRRRQRIIFILLLIAVIACVLLEFGLDAVLGALWPAGQALFWTALVLLEILILIIALLLLVFTIVDWLNEGMADPLSARLLTLQALAFVSITLLFAEILILSWRHWYGEPLNAALASLAGLALIAATTLCAIPVVRIRGDAHSMARIISLVEGQQQPDHLANTRAGYAAGIIACAIGFAAWIAWLWS